MAALVVDNVASFDLAGLREALAERLHGYARPMFLRFRPKLDLTGTFKPRKIELVAEGFDPERCGDPVYVDDRRAGAYVRVEPEFVAAVKTGAIAL
jgi:fatty-acyl-CoA synthase